MLRIFLALVGVLLATHSLASEESSLSLLDNRFRVDPTIKQITFVIYRAERSQPVVLVRPDGKKYYSWKSPDNVNWYQESAMDIVTIDDPMPGPWQAIGKVTPKNKIKLLSHLKLTTDTFPSRLFHGEQIKFTARLTSEDKPVVLRDFLDRVKLKVTFTKFVENEDSLANEARPVPEVIGEFADDGRGLDERPGDGIFTVSLPISPQPGKYRVRVTSGNGVFLRAQEQEVLVYPTPVQATFIQAREKQQAHQIVVSGEQGMIEPGTIAAHIEHENAQGDKLDVEQAASQDAMKVTLIVPQADELGNFRWSGVVYASELSTRRPLVFPLTEKTYSVVDDVNIAETRRLQEEEQAKRDEMLEQIRLLQEREAQRQRSTMIILIGNIAAIALGLIVWLVMRKIRMKRAAIPEMQLDMPTKK